MKKFIFFIVVVAAILFASKLGLEYYYGKKLDQFITQVSYVADVNYRKVAIGTDGSISISNLSISPHAADTFIRMDSITLFSSDILLPINLASFIKRREFPSELGLRVSNMEYDPSLYEPTIQQSDKCRSIETTISAQLTGIYRLNANFEASIQVNANTGVVKLSSTDQVAEMEAQATFDASMLESASAIPGSQPLDEITVKYKLNEQVASELIQTCAALLSMSADDYLNNIVGSPAYLKSTGADFGIDANSAMIELMQGGKWLSIRSKPNSQLRNINSLGFYKAKDIVRLLDIKVTMDSQEVALNVSELDVSNPARAVTTDSDIDKQAAEEIRLEEELSHLNAEEQQRIKQKLEDVASSNDDKYSYKVTSGNNLNRYINHSVIFKRSGDKKQIGGELVAIEDGFFIIETGQYGGKAKFNVAMTDVIEALVYR